MAANDYYNTKPQNHYPELDFSAPLPIAPNQKPLPGAPSPFNDPVYPSDPYHTQDSQHSLGGDSSYYGQNDGRAYNQDPYADNIPLKAQTSKPSPERLNATSQPYDPGLENGAGESPILPAKKRRRNRFFSSSKGRTPWLVYALTLIQITVFIAELVKNAVLTKTPIEIHPQFNPMIGPSTWVLINMGARFVPCMRNTPGIQDTHPPPVFPCPNSTSSVLTDPSNQCSLADVCGFSGVPNPTSSSSLTTSPQPNQWFRFIVPIFLHAGIVHIGFNMLLQLLLGSDIERLIGPVRFFIVYFSSGIFGFILGGNFAPDGISSMFVEPNLSKTTAETNTRIRGASGCLFGILALTLLDLLYTWKQRRSPFKDLAFIGLDVVISFILGLLPGLDNFSHIGGFLMGLVLGISILHSPDSLRQRIGEDASPYEPVRDGRSSKDPNAGLRDFVKRPVGFFQGRKPLWWAWWIFRAVALLGALIAFIVLLNNFYKYRNTCSWCKYLSCLPIKNWCDVGNLNITPINNTTSPNKRDMFGAAFPDFMPPSF
ncbi:MAG: hypothetical protein M4579_002943 [Chaenotheca gracillima]|nr:MAG: hypothetical protein M4579_002943 [Chaenotheca gracillima]